MSTLLDKAQEVLRTNTAHSWHAALGGVQEKALLGDLSDYTREGLFKIAVSTKAIFDLFDYLAAEYGLTELVGPDIAGGQQAQILDRLNTIINMKEQEQA